MKQMLVRGVDDGMALVCPPCPGTGRNSNNKDKEQEDKEAESRQRFLSGQGSPLPPRQTCSAKVLLLAATSLLAAAMVFASLLLTSGELALAVTNIMREHTVLAPGSQALQYWTEPPITPKLKVFRNYAPLLCNNYF